MKKFFPVSKLALVACLFLGVHATSHSADSVSVSLGSGDRTDMVRVGAQWNWAAQWWKSNNTHIGGYWNLNLAKWRGNRFRNIPNNRQDLFAIGLTPVFRFQRDSLTGPYAEFGIGVYYLSELYDNDDKKLSTKFQFGDHIGVGYVFNNRLDVGVKLQHFSNGGIKKPNSGVDMLVVEARYGF